MAAPVATPASRWPSWLACWPSSALREAINLDGGGSTSLVCAGELRNRPRADFGVPLPGGRPIATALVFSPR